MSEKTRAKLDAAATAYQTAQTEAAVTGQAPAGVDRSAYEAAARAYLKEVDPDYLDREGGKPFHDRVAAPDLKADYDAALAAFHADMGSPRKAALANSLGEEYAAVRQAARVAEGRPAGPPAPAGDVQEG